MDIFSYALTLYELTHRIPAWNIESVAELLGKWKSGKRPVIAEYIKTRCEESTHLKVIIGVMELCWINDPVKRPTASQILNQIKIV